MTQLIELMWNPDISKQYDKDLHKLIQLFEEYAFQLNKKITTINEIKNLALELEHNYIKNDPININSSTKKVNHRVKKIVLKRLKNIKEINSLEAKKIFQSNQYEDDAITCVNKLSNNFAELFKKNQNENLQIIHEKFASLYQCLNIQRNIITMCIEQVTHWPLDDNERILKEFKKLTEHLSDNCFTTELRLVFNMNISPNYNNIQSDLHRKLKTHQLPESSRLRALLENEQAFVQEKRRNKSEEIITCYHGRIAREATKVFPLDIKKNPRGLFVFQANQKEMARKHVAEIYGLPEHEIIVIRIEMPKYLFEQSINDNNNDLSLKESNIEFARVFKPTKFPLLNESFYKGYILEK